MRLLEMLMQLGNDGMEKDWNQNEYEFEGSYYYSVESFYENSRVFCLFLHVYLLENFSN